MTVKNSSFSAKYSIKHFEVQSTASVKWDLQYLLKIYVLVIKISNSYDKDFLNYLANCFRSV